MQYKVAITDPIEMNGKMYFGVTVRNDSDEVLYTEKFPNQTNAEQHCSRLRHLLQTLVDVAD